MNTLTPKRPLRRWNLCSAGAMLVLAAAVTAWTPAQAGAAEAAQAVPQSVFTADARGIDPFFPGSVRRGQAQIPSVGTTNAAPVAAPVAHVPLVLKGISGSKLQPLALINNATLGTGESRDIRVGTQTIKVRCREIRGRSVFVEIEPTGEIRELKLRDGI